MEYEQNSKNDLPFISSILVTYNESQYIERSLKSLINQDYPNDRYEIIVVDGGSTDETIKKTENLIAEYSKENNILRIRILHNPKKFLAAGWNIGIKNAKGEYVIRIDAHAEVNRDFLRLNVETMRSVNAVCVGGKLITKSDNETGELIRVVLSSPFGVGNSSFRTSNTPGYTDTAVYGLYKKQIFEEVGYFNEELIRNQDIEMHSRIKKSGGKFYFNPEIESTYYSRDSVKKMLKQAYGNGMWNLIILKANHAKLSIRHLIPLCFLIFLIAAGLLGIICNIIWVIELAVLCLYFILGFIAGLKKTKKVKNVIVLPFLFFLFHITYGFGSMIGLLKGI